MTVRELLVTTSSRELAEWMAYYKIEHEEQQQRFLEQKAQQGIQRQKKWRR